MNHWKKIYFFVFPGILIWIIHFLIPQWIILNAPEASVVSCPKFMTGSGEDVHMPQNLYAQAAVMIDGLSGRVLYSKNGDDILPMASTTKIMTCILALEMGKPDDIVIVTEYADSMPEVSLGIRSGERYYLQDMLYALMLESHNDSAVAVAESIGGDVEHFAKMMNEKAEEIGCSETYFITPNGLDAVGIDAQGNERQHSTTAADLAKMLRYCMVLSPEKEAFKKITTASAWSFCDLSGEKNFSVSNKNSYLNMREGASCGKTGFTGKAGYCYVGSVESEGRLFIVSLLACGWPNNKSYKWHDMNALVDYGEAVFHYKALYREPRLPAIPVINGMDESSDDWGTAYVGTRVEDGDNRDQTMGVLVKEQETADISVEIAKELEAPVEKGQKVGKVTYRLDDSVIAEYNIVTDRSVECIDFPRCLSRVIRQFICP